MKSKFGHKILITVLVTASWVFLFACGGGGGGGTPQDPPSISNLTYSPTSANLNSGGGTVTVNGTTDFVDEGGNLSTLTISVFNSAGNQVSTNSAPITGLAGVKSGRIYGSFIVSTTTLGNFSFQVYVTDAKGSKSTILTGSFSIKDVWTTKAPLPTPRYGLAASAVNGKIYAIGGVGGSNKVEEYDPATDTWTTKTPMPTGRSWLAAEVVNGKIYAIGGDEGAQNLSNKVEEFNPTTDTWKTKTPLPTPRYSLAASALNGKIYAIGGIEMEGGDSNEVEEYDPAKDI